MPSESRRFRGSQKKLLLLYCRYCQTIEFFVEILLCDKKRRWKFPRPWLLIFLTSCQLIAIYLLISRWTLSSENYYGCCLRVMCYVIICHSLWRCQSSECRPCFYFLMLRTTGPWALFFSEYHWEAAKTTVPRDRMVGHPPEWWKNNSTTTKPNFCEKCDNIWLPWRHGVRFLFVVEEDIYF